MAFVRPTGAQQFLPGSGQANARHFGATQLVLNAAGAICGKRTHFRKPVACLFQTSTVQGGCGERYRRRCFPWERRDLAFRYHGSGLERDRVGVGTAPFGVWACRSEERPLAAAIGLKFEHSDARKAHPWLKMPLFGFAAVSRASTAVYNADDSTNGRPPRRVYRVFR